MPNSKSFSGSIMASTTFLPSKIKLKSLKHRRKQNGIKAQHKISVIFTWHFIKINYRGLYTTTQKSKENLLFSLSLSLSA